jgi:hypothetical protein
MADQKFVRGNITIENATLIFRNFKGEGRDFNPEGRRVFSVLIDDDIASKLKEDGWNVRYLKPREEGDKPKACLKVNVSYAKNPPQVYVIVDGVKRPIGEGEIAMLDWAEIISADLQISPYNYNKNGRSGVSGYLKRLYATIQLDELERKYEGLQAAGNHNEPPWDTE